MNMQFQKLTALSLCLTPAFALNAQPTSSPIQQTEKPNILLFLVDDMGWQDTSVPFWKERTLFNDRYCTPNMEEIAENGLSFTDAYAAPICSPTRTSIMTGEAPINHHVTNWTLIKDKPTEHSPINFKPPQWKWNGLQPGDSKTLPEALREVGYTTVHCGKAHWGVVDSPGEDPRNLGFDINIAGHAAGGPGSYYGEKNYGNNPDGTRNKPWGIPGLEKYYGTDTFLTDALTQEAKLALEPIIDEGKPFYLYMSHYAIHSPFMPDPKYVQKYLDMGLDKTEAAYCSLIEGMDASLGELIDFLDEKGVAENTLILFTTDNGGPTERAGVRGKSPYGSDDTHNYPLREGKGSCYEGGVRVPTMVAPAKRGPNNPEFLKRIPQNAKTNTFFICEDIYPTLLSIAGYKDWDSIPQQLDGKDMSSYFDGHEPDSENQNRPWFIHTPHQWTNLRSTQATGYQPYTALRQGDYKVIYFYLTRQWELYNIREDIGEQHDLAKTNKELLHQMQATFKKEAAKTKMQLPTDVFGIPKKIKYSFPDLR